MSRPHFLDISVLDVEHSGPRQRRRFRGNFMVDSPIFPPQIPMSDTPYLPSMDELRQMMRRQSEMSQQQMTEIRRKLESGEYLTRKAAELSAERLLDDGDI